MQKIEHIGIAVKDLEKSEALFSLLFGNGPYKREMVESQAVNTSFFKNGPNKIELLQGTSDDSIISKFVAKKGEGIHHIAFAVMDIKLEMARLQEAGFKLLHEEPIPGADNKLICFLHPKSSNGVLIELCQDIKS